MDAQLAEFAQLEWDDALRVTRAEGACERVIRRSATDLVGMLVVEALGITPEQLAEIDGRALRNETEPHFTRCRVASPGICLRVRTRAEGRTRHAVFLDMEAVLTGAPPLQISRISSSLSHEIRNPLSSVKMAVQTLARNPNLSERDQRRLTIANREVRTMERMLWLFSEYGRDTSARLDSVPVRTVLAEAAATIAPELDERKIGVEIGPADETPGPIIRADIGRVRPVLAQLFLNVAMGQVEGSKVAVRVETAEHAVRVLISDPSAALPAEDRPTLFEPFGSMLARGAGLSLAALYRVMLHHGGTVTADSTDAGGTQYTLTFPI